MTHTQYIEGPNPYNLSGPPKFWLDKLRDFDDSLYVIPSQQAFLYRLAQKRPRIDPRADLIHSLQGDSDSKLLASYGLVPVTTIIATAKWDNPLMWEDLRQRAPHRMGGAEAVEKLLQERDRQADLDIARQNDAMLTDVGKDAWKYYLLKSGRRTALYAPKTAERREAPSFGRSAAIRILGSDGKPVQFKS